jgi:hypothetical protein
MGDGIFAQLTLNIYTQSLPQAKLLSPRSPLPTLLNIHQPKPHLTLIRIGLWFVATVETADYSTTAKFTLSPARLTVTIGHEAGLTDLLGSNNLVIDNDY